MESAMKQALISTDFPLQEKEMKTVIITIMGHEYAHFLSNRLFPLKHENIWDG